MNETETWTIDGTEATDATGECYWIDDGRLYATEYAGSIPLDAVADLLRAVGFVVISPKAQQELGSSHLTRSIATGTL